MKVETYFTAADWVILALYFVLTMGIGFYFYRKSRSVEGFTAASRALPGWACGLSIFATYLSSISFLGLPGKSFGGNWNPFVFSLSIPVATWIAVKFFLPYYRKTGEVSAYAHLEHRFGTWARMYASFFYVLTQLARMGVVMYLMALPLSVLLGKDIRLIILFTGLSVTVYSFVGGIAAIIWADALQAIVLMVGAIACSVMMLMNMPEGPGQVFEIAAANDKFSLGSFGPSLTNATFWVVLVYGVVINLQNFGIDQSYIQRYIASKNTKEARKSIWLGGLLYLPVSAVFFFIGTQLYAYYQTHPEYMQEVRYTVAEQQLLRENVSENDADFKERLEERAETVTVSEMGDKVFPHFIGKQLPVGVTGLLIAAIFAAAMSTVSTSLNSSATLITTDWYQRFINKKHTERQSMLAIYTATILWGLLGTGTALLLVNITSALDAWWTLAGIFGGGMLGLFLLGLISRRASSPIAAASVIMGLIVIAYMTLSPKIGALPDHLKSHLHSFLIPVFGTMVILVAGLLITKIVKRRT
ncbi:Na(+)/glucose symporter [Sedimentisphaera cyanobacteriorum]|uniref:Na(+)/glucose symporter n=1 Tax=Sedimentisphaera cyanobacteriorum TaxID=1940790 RepID=A0A1Q2HQF4_9BACT|nr:sodium:solute symporter [Sedimentisphaera cyanobacteriorum]AQQ09682.1 Na(+)/glucose symporter [Sedimentisphaera cyanobacteriorum]